MLEFQPDALVRPRSSQRDYLPAQKRPLANLITSIRACTASAFDERGKCRELFTQTTAIDIHLQARLLVSLSLSESQTSRRPGRRVCACVAHILRALADLLRPQWTPCDCSACFAIHFAAALKRPAIICRPQNASWWNVSKRCGNVWTV